MTSLEIIKDELRWLTAIAEAENDADLQAATKALSVAVEKFKAIDNTSDCKFALEITDEAIESIANILSGGKTRREDGK